MKNREQLSKEALEREKIELAREERTTPQTVVVQAGPQRGKVIRDEEGNIQGVEYE